MLKAQLSVHPPVSVLSENVPDRVPVPAVAQLGSEGVVMDGLHGNPFCELQTVLTPPLLVDEDAW